MVVPVTKQAVALYQQEYGAFSARALAEEPTGRQAVERLLREAAAEYTDPGHPRGCLIICGAVNCGPESAEVEELMRGFREASKAALKERIDGDLAAGALPPGTDTADLATFYAVVIQDMSAQSRDGATREALERTASLAMAAWPAPVTAT
jgi:hypothetical protein